MVRATAGRFVVLNAEFTFLSHAPRAADASGARAEMYDDSEVEMPVALRTKGVPGQVAGTGAYPDSAACAEERMPTARIKEVRRCILEV